MKKSVCLFVLLLFLAACGGSEPDETAVPVLEDAPTETAVPELTATPFPVVVQEEATDEVISPTVVPEVVNTPLPAVAERGISFDIPAELASDVIEVSFEEAVTADPNAPFWANYPAYTKLVLSGYPETHPIYDAQIDVYSIPAFASVNVTAAGEIEKLNRLLENRPEPSSLTAEDVPFLPLINAQQVFHAQLDYVGFQNGRGVRYLTQYAQQPTTIHNDGLFYTFQGMTDDGRHYVSAIFPVSSAQFADSPPETEAEFNALAEDYLGYLLDALTALQQIPAESFSPPLSALDQLIASGMVNLREPQVETTDAGRVPLSILYPSENGQARTGRPMLIEGVSQPGAENDVLVSLRSGPNELASATFPSEVNGRWSGELDVPYSVEGQAVLVVSKAGEETRSNVVLVRDPEVAMPGAVVDIYRPSAGHTAVSGYTLFLEGRTTNPIDDTMTVGLLMDDCSTFVARQSFTLLAPGGSWNAQLILPRDIRGEACVVAYTGEYGVGEWREIHLPITVTDEGDSRAPRLELASLYQESYQLGDAVYVYGSAVGTSTVTVRFLLSGEEEVAVVSVPVGGFGFWEATIDLPTEDAAGSYLLEVTIPGDDESLAQSGFEVFE